MAADPTLDADVAAWFDRTADRQAGRPRTRHPVHHPAGQAQTAATTPSWPPTCAFRDHGATTEEIRTAFSLSAGIARTYLSTLRESSARTPSPGRVHGRRQEPTPPARPAASASTRPAGCSWTPTCSAGCGSVGRPAAPPAMEDYATALRLVTGRAVLPDARRRRRLAARGRPDRPAPHRRHRRRRPPAGHQTPWPPATPPPPGRPSTSPGWPRPLTRKPPAWTRPPSTVADGRTDEARRTLVEQVCNRSDDGDPPHGPQPPNPADPRPPP